MMRKQPGVRDRSWQEGPNSRSGAPPATGKILAGFLVPIFARFFFIMYHFFSISQYCTMWTTTLFGEKVRNAHAGTPVARLGAADKHINFLCEDMLQVSMPLVSVLFNGLEMHQGCRRILATKMGSRRYAGELRLDVTHSSLSLTRAQPTKIKEIPLSIFLFLFLTCECGGNDGGGNLHPTLVGGARTPHHRHLFDSPTVPTPPSVGKPKTL